MEDKYYFDYDCSSKEVVNECTINPTDILKEESDWLYAGNDKYLELDSSKVGKWMVFLHKAEVNEIWNKIKQAIKEGHLWHSKVSTSDLSNPVHAIMIYTKDYNDVDDVINVLDYLESSGIKPSNKVIHYKTDRQTLSGVYSGGKQRASIYSSNTIKHSRMPHGNPVGESGSWRRRDGANTPNRYFKNN